jgi:hypothetical protein
MSGNPSPSLRVVDGSLACSEQSLCAGEPLRGTATHVELWILLEHRGAWEPQALDSALPEGARAWLRSAAAHARSRVLLVRRPAAEGPLTLVVMRSGPSTRERRYALADHDALARVPLAEVAPDALPVVQAPRPMVLVCTHGRRDRCCARHGTALYRDLAALAPDAELWQSSHQGGHRFAANVVLLPEGVQYGRLRAEHARGLVAARAEGKLFDLAHYRGQTRWAAPAQTAEAWLRGQLEELRFDAIELASEEALEDGCHGVTLRTRDGLLHRITVAERQGVSVRSESCDGEATAPRWLEVVRHASHGTSHENG